MSNIVLIDSGSLAFQIYGLAGSMAEARDLAHFAGDWGSFAKLPIGTDPRRVIWCHDSKPYWRTSHYPEYKAGRAPKPNEVKLISQYLRGVPGTHLEGEGWEADDWIASCVRHYSDNHRLFVVTCDSDLMQLVGPNVTWVNTLHHAPVLRDVPEVLAWCHRRLGEGLCRTPRDIAKVKAEKGDRSDNLPPGSPIGLIDLWNPLEAPPLPRILNRRSRRPTMRWSGRVSDSPANRQLLISKLEAAA